MEKQQNKTIKVIKLTILSIYYLVIGLLLLFSIATLSVKRNDDIPNLFGRGFLAVNEKADSMVGENKDSFNPGDLVFIKVLSDQDRLELDLAKLATEGTVISFYDHNIKSINTHRVVEYNAVIDEGRETIRTQGDNESSPDNFYLHRNDIIGVYTGKASGLGKPISFMQTPLGFGVVVVAPTLLLLLFQGYVLIKNIYVVKETKMKESFNENKELERERIRQELLEELKKEENNKERID